MSTTTATVGTLLRLSVSAGGQAVDFGAPGDIPVAELLPGLARTLGLLNATTSYGGYWLILPDGTVIDSARSLQAQGVPDGAILTMEAGALRPQPRVYDDIVEAVSDAVAEHNQGWTPRDSAVTAVFSAAGLLIAGIVLLISVAGNSTLTSLISAVSALLVLGAAAVVDRASENNFGARILTLTATIFGFVAGFVAVGAEASWGVQLAAAGGAMVITAAIGIAALQRGREICAAPIAVGLTLASVGGAVALTAAPAAAVVAVTVAILITASNATPWLALARTPIRVLPVHASGDGVATGAPIDPVAVAHQFAAGHRLQVSLRTAIGVIAILSIPTLVSAGVVGLALLLAGFVGMLLSVRKSYSRYDVAAIMSTGIIGALGACLVAALSNPSWRPGLTIAVGVGAIAVIAMTLVAPKSRYALTRVADTVELLCLAALLPLGASAAGLV